MRIHICAIGRLRRGPEQDLIDDYLKRFSRTGRALGLSLGDLHTPEPRKSGDKAQEADLLRRSIPKGSVVWALDEHGQSLTSPQFAKSMADLRDQGNADLSICIGGADGLDPSLKSEAQLMISFGKMVWPHMLARVMLCEQLYRAASILAGAPYHRS